MQPLPYGFRLAVTALTLLGTMLMSACSPPTSSLDQAYYSGELYNPGAYTRSIFSSHNF